MMRTETWFLLSMLVKIGQKYNVEHKSDPYRYMDNITMYKLQDVIYISHPQNG